MLSQNGTLAGAWAARLEDQAAPNEEALQEMLKGVEPDTGDLIDEIKFTAENLLIQTREIKENLQTLMKEMLGNF